MYLIILIIVVMLFVAGFVVRSYLRSRDVGIYTQKIPVSDIYEVYHQIST